MSKVQTYLRSHANRRGASVVALAAFGLLAHGDFARADISLGSSWVANGPGGFDSFHDYNSSDVLTPTFRANNDTWLRVDLHDQFFSYLAADTNTGLTAANIAANPDIQFDLDMTEWTWPTVFGVIEYFSNSSTGGGADGSVIFNTAGLIGNNTHVSVNLTSLLSPGGLTRVDAGTNIGIKIEPAGGGTYPALSTHYYIDNVSLTPVPVPPTLGSANWKTPGSGTWSGSSSANWDVALPDAQDDAATFGTFGGTITTPTTVTVSGAVTVGTLNFDNTAGYTLNGGGVTLDTATTGTHGILTAINVLSGNATINSQVVKGTNANPIDFNVVQASSTLKIPNFSGQFYTFQKDGAGKLVINKADQVTLLVNGGTVQFAASGTQANISRAFFMNVAPTASLDLTNNGFVYQYGGATGVQDTMRGLLQNGYANGSWTGTGGIISSSASSVSGIHKTAIGYVDTADPQFQNNFDVPNFTGTTLDATTVLMRYTLAGDANLDNTVDVSDFNKLAMNYGTTGEHWYEGDFNYDGIVNLLDLNSIATNFGQTLPSSGVALGALVPEPTSLAALGFAAMLLKRRSRKHPG